MLAINIMETIFTPSENSHIALVSMHGHVDCTPAQIDRLEQALHGIGRGRLNQKGKYLRWAKPAGRGFLIVELHLAVYLDKKSEDQFLSVTIDARGFRTASKLLRDEAKLRELTQALASMESESLQASFDCNVAWLFSVEEAEPLMRLPFSFPVASSSELTSVTGIRIANPDGSAWVIIDLITDAKRIHVAAGFKLEHAANPHMLGAAVEHGETLVREVLNVKGGER